MPSMKTANSGRSLRIARGLASTVPADELQINIIEPLRLCAQIEVLSNYFCGAASDPRKKNQILGRAQQRPRERLMIMLRHQDAAHAVFDCFGNSAVLGCKYRQTAGHRFEHRIWNAFLISVATNLARVQENVRPIVNLPQLLLRDEAGE